MEFKFRIKVGATEIEITENASSQREFFEKISFFSGLPTKGPNGAEDLKIVYRKTKSGDEFYSIVSETDDMEYKFGIHKNADKTLFPKGWVELYKGGNNDDDGQAQQEQAPAKSAAGKNPFANKGAKPAPATASEEIPDAEYTEPQETVPTPSLPKTANLPKPAVTAPKAPTAPAPAGGTSPAVNSILNKYLKK